KRVQVELKAVGDCIVVDLRGELARSCKFLAIQVCTLRHGTQFIWCPARMAAAAATDMNTQLMRSWIESALESSHDRSGDSRGMPVHSHQAAQSLKPEGIAEAREQFRLPIVIENAFGDRRAQAGHSLGQPSRYTSAM